MSLLIYDASDHVAPRSAPAPCARAPTARDCRQNGRVLAASPFWIEAPGTRLAIRAAADLPAR